MNRLLIGYEHESNVLLTREGQPVGVLVEALANCELVKIEPWNDNAPAEPGDRRLVIKILPEGDKMLERTEMAKDNPDLSAALAALEKAAEQSDSDACTARYERDQMKAELNALKAQLADIHMAKEPKSEPEGGDE